MLFGYLAVFLTSANEKSIGNVLRGKLWQSALMPLLEFIPVISIFPFWMGAVIRMWFLTKSKLKLKQATSLK
jgi:hypothetical protein